MQSQASGRAKRVSRPSFHSSLGNTSFLCLCSSLPSFCSLLSTLLTLVVIMEIIKHLKFGIKIMVTISYCPGASLLYKVKADSSPSCEHEVRDLLCNREYPDALSTPNWGHTIPCSADSRTLLIMKGKSFQPERGKVLKLKLIVIVFVFWSEMKLVSRMEARH